MQVADAGERRADRQSADRSGQAGQAQPAQVAGAHREETPAQQHDQPLPRGREIPAQRDPEETAHNPEQGRRRDVQQATSGVPELTAQPGLQRLACGRRNAASSVWRGVDSEARRA